MRVGSWVIVRAYPGEKLRRRIVEVRPSTIVVTSEDELRAAQAQGREPMRVGFPLADVLKVLEDSN